MTSISVKTPGTMDSVVDLFGQKLKILTWAPKNGLTRSIVHGFWPETENFYFVKT